MKTLNLFPYYETLVKQKLKRASLRLGDQTTKYSVGDKIHITVGWNLKRGSSIASAVITHTSIKRVGHLMTEDLQGGSPDCSKPEAIKCVMSAIYRQVVTESNAVTIVKWRYLQ